MVVGQSWKLNCNKIKSLLCFKQNVEILVFFFFIMRRLFLKLIKIGVGHSYLKLLKEMWSSVTPLNIFIKCKIVHANSHHCSLSLISIHNI